MDEALIHLRSRFLMLLATETANLAALDLTTAAVEEGQAGLKAIAHRVSGVAGMFDATTLQSSAAHVESALAAPVGTPILKTLAQHLRHAIDAYVVSSEPVIST